MNKKVINLLVTLTRNNKGQKMLEKIVNDSQRIMGIGAGAGVNSSGEKVLMQLLMKSHKITNRPLCIFDVGANKGQFLTLIDEGLQKILYDIHAFEPGKDTFKILSENFSGKPNANLNNLGLGDKSGEFPLYYDKPGSGLASLFNRKLAHFGNDFKLSENVRIETLDDYCKDHSIKNIDLLKLDVEGNELAVLNGGLKMFGSKKISMVSFEFGGCNIDSRTFFQDFWYFFQEIGGFEIFRITPSGYLMPILKYKETLEQFRTTNFVAIQK